MKPCFTLRGYAKKMKYVHGIKIDNKVTILEFQETHLRKVEKKQERTTRSRRFGNCRVRVDISGEIQCA